MLEHAIARDGEEFSVRSNGGDWLIAWFPPDATPDGIAHGANAFCMTADDSVVLVRSIWLAEVKLTPWEPRFEIRYRRVVPTAELLAHLWMEEGFEPIYHRALVEAGLVFTDF